MNKVKDLFVKGKYYIFVGFAVLIETERKYGLPYTNSYKKTLENAKEELKYVDPDTDYSKI